MILVKDRTGSKNGISGGRQDTGGKDAERLYQRLQSCSQAGLRDAGMRVSGLYDAVFIVGI